MTGAGDAPASPIDPADEPEGGEVSDADGHTDAQGEAGVGGSTGAGGAPWWRGPRVLVGAGLVAVAVLVGAGTIVLAAGGDGDAAAPITTSTGVERTSTTRATTTTIATTTTTSTTTTTAPAPTTAPATVAPVPDPAGPAPADPPDDGFMSSIPPAPTSVSCSPYWVPSGESTPPATQFPGQSASYGAPTTACADVAGGCAVSFSQRWTDGFVGGSSQVLTAPGTYTLAGDRGASWTFGVGADLYCVSHGGHYENFWPSGA
jgi:hypothetical protein